ncbi:MAG: hypothetical protein ACOH18_03275 [Candidatus Saccharimonadaceae bacterium]
MEHKLKIKLFIGVPILMVLAFVATFLLLHFFGPKTDTATNNTAVATKPSEIIKKMKEPGTVSQLLNLYTIQNDTPVGIATINYTKEGSYATSIAATDSVGFSQKDVAASKNPTVVKDSIETFLNTNGLKKIAPSAENSLSTLFDSEQTTCQLIDLPTNGSTGATLTMSCIEKSTINNQYSAIDKHLQMYKDEKGSSLNPSTILSNTIKENNKTLNILNIYGSDKSAVTLLFAAIDENWEYIGSRTLSTDAGDGKTTIDTSLSDELQTNIHNAKYDGFLEKYVQ